MALVPDIEGIQRIVQVCLSHSNNENGYNLNGGRRAMVPTGVFERLMPQDYLPTQLLRSLLACDLIAFHVNGYAQNFLDCAERTLGARVDRESMRVEYGDHTTRVRALPMPMRPLRWRGRS